MGVKSVGKGLKVWGKGVNRVEGVIRWGEYRGHGA